MIRVVLIDDHGLVRTGYRMILEKETDMDVVGEAADGEEGLVLVRREKPDIVICDLHLPGMSGLDVTERIVRAKYGSKVIMVSVQQDGPLPRRVMEAGASGYLGKAAPAEEMLAAIRAVHRGKSYLGSEVARKMALSSMQGSDSPFDQLTPRELEVMMMLVRGHRSKAIAESLSLSAKTISTHKLRLYEKLEVNDLASLTRLASRHGVLEPDNQ